MTTASAPDDGGSATVQASASAPAPEVRADDGFPTPTAGMVLHRVLATSARTFLLNDMGNELVDDRETHGPVDATTLGQRSRPVWALSAESPFGEAVRRNTEDERIHQSRVALRRIRSNLRTFRLALDPAWGTALRAELAWYGRTLGESRDLHIMAEVVATTGAEVLRPDQVERLAANVAGRQTEATSRIAAERGGARRFQLTEQMMVLWDGPDFKPKAARPAEEVLVPMLQRAWHDLRGAARTARRDASDANLHLLRIRLKDLRYGCETVAMVEGGPARKTAKAAERLQTKLGDLHDAAFSIAWFESLALEERDLAEPLARMVEAQEQARVTARKGWRAELKGIERRWRKWMT
ncbi:MAG: CHAD domain-containing protein [Acidimicrobiales bacterium]